MATITKRATKGSPLTNDEVDANFENLNTDKLETSGGSVTGDISFGDNDKAIFGAGSDLQIYHDSATGHSIISEVGSGSLQLRGTNIQLKNADNTKNYIAMTNDGDVDLYYDNSIKLATTNTGIDVTGTVTADGLTVDGDGTLQTSDGAILNLKSTDTANATDDVYGSVDFISSDVSSSASGRRARIAAKAADDSGGSYLTFETSEAFNLGDDRERLRINKNGDISFYEDTGTTAKFFWDASAESLGIGEDDPKTILHTYGTSSTTYDPLAVGGQNTSATLRIQNASTAANTFSSIDFNTNNNRVVNRIVSSHGATTTDGFLAFITEGSGVTAEAMRLDSSGRLLIGTDTNTDNYIFQVDSAVNTVAQFTRYAADGADLVIGSSRGTQGSKTALAINDIAGQLSFKAYQGSAFSSIASVNAACEAAPASGDTPGRLVFSTTADGASSPTERMRISQNGISTFTVRTSVGGPITGVSPDAAFTVQNAGADIGKITAVFGADENSSSLTNNTNKETRVGIPHYVVAEEPPALFYANSTSSENQLTIGGGTSRMNAMNSIRFRTTANTNTVTGTEAARIDSSQRFLIGGTSSQPVGTGSTGFALQVQGDDFGTSGITLQRYAAEQPGPSIIFAKTRSTTVGSGRDIVSDGDELGKIRFYGADGTDFQSLAAHISADVDGTPGANDLPGRLVFRTTADGASSPTERMRINNAGFVGIGTGGNDPNGILELNESSSVAATTKAQTGYPNLIIKDTSGSFADERGGAISFEGVYGALAKIAGVKANGANSGSFRDFGELVFYTHGNSSEDNYAALNEAARFNSGGNLAFPNGQGIDFSSSEGSGASSSVLDDYEEGTWTPALNAGTNTYSTQTGYYRKVGAIVTYWMDLNITSTSGAGSFNIPLPFANANLTSNYTCNLIAWDVDSSHTGSTQRIKSFANPNTSNLLLYKSSAGNDNVSTTMSGTTGRISGTFIQFTAS